VDASLSLEGEQILGVPPWATRTPEALVETPRRS